MSAPGAMTHPGAYANRWIDRAVGSLCGVHHRPVGGAAQNLFRNRAGVVSHAGQDSGLDRWHPRHAGKEEAGILAHAVSLDREILLVDHWQLHQSIVAAI